MRTLLLLFTVVSSVLTVSGQVETKHELTDEFPATLCSDDLRSRIDSFFAAISQRPGSLGSIVVTPDRAIPGRALKYRRIIENHVRFPNFDPNRVLYAERPMSESRIQLWIYPKGSQPESSRPEPWRISESTLFDAGGIYTDPFTLKIEFGEPSDEPCDFGVSFDQFAAVFRSNKNLFAHVLFSSGGRIGRGRANSAANIAVKHLIDFGVARELIKTKYAGKRKQAELQLWLVPKGGVQPVFRDGAVP